MATSSQSRLVPSACIFMVSLFYRIVYLSFFKQKRFCLYCQWVLYLNEIEQYFIRTVLQNNKGKAGKLLELICVELWGFLVKKCQNLTCTCKKQFVKFRMGLYVNNALFCVTGLWQGISGQRCHRRVLQVQEMNNK